jgi:hypothetical protein
VGEPSAKGHRCGCLIAELRGEKGEQELPGALGSPQRMLYFMPVFILHGIAGVDGTADRLMADVLYWTPAVELTKVPSSSNVSSVVFKCS